MKNIILLRNKKVWGAAVAAVLFLTCFLPVNIASAADPIPVDGMIIPTSKTGDSSAWVEIANYGDYMLIIRQNPITSELTMYRTDGKQENTYSTSTLRIELNNWYNNKLDENARLREYAVMSDAATKFGFYASISEEGQSKPNGIAAATGNDVVFALSFSEALYFCSTQYQYQSGNTSSIMPSSTIAYNNFQKLLPAYEGGSQGDNPSPAFWLRTPGSTKQNAGAVAFQGGSPMADVAGRVNQHLVLGAYAHYRPAMWVDKRLIEEKDSVWPFSGASGSPIVTDGRILTKDKTGDVSDWVEIARNGKYSLIVRKNFINRQEFNYGNPEWQSATFTNNYSNNDYMDSRVRHNINHWFNILVPIPNNLGIPGVYDVLPWNSRLRDYTMQSNATLQAIGTSNYRISLTDGISRPTFYQVGIGDDIAFSLSFGEAAEFASIMRFMRNEETALWNSPALAAKNFAKIVIPTRSPGSYNMWLRSLADKNMASSMNSSGTVFQSNLNSNLANDYGFIYPAVWVDSEIFGNQPKKPMYEPPAPSVVDGRILTKEQTGDISEWVEIAKSNGYSLIVRKNFVNQQGFNYGNPLWQSVNYGYDFESNNYMTSRIRHNINHWFNIGFPLPNNLGIKETDDVLPWDARLRKFTVQNNANYNIGTSSTFASLNDGISRPSNYKVGIGNDVAFALSYAEAANFLSKTHFVHNANPALQPSHPLALLNYSKISFPPGGSDVMWLRSPGDVARTAGALSNYNYYGAVFQADVYSGNTLSRGFIYPALWVGEGIFGDKATINVFHKDADTGNLLDPQETHSVNAGKYGPYNAKTFPNYGAGYLASGSDPREGVVDEGETRNITYLYPPYMPPVHVFYHPNGGKGEYKMAPVTRNEPYTVEDQGYTMEMFDFVNWNTESNGGGTTRNNGDTFIVTGDTTLYAQWKPQPAGRVSVIYEPNGGVGVRREVQVIKGSSYSFEDMEYTMHLFNFAGWNTTPNGHGVTKNIGEIDTINGDMILYAQWKRKI